MPLRRLIGAPGCSTFSPASAHLDETWLGGDGDGGETSAFLRGGTDLAARGMRWAEKQGKCSRLQ